MSRFPEQGQAMTLIHASFQMSDTAAQGCPRPFGPAQGRALAALSGGLKQRFHSWSGRSGQRYVCSVIDRNDVCAMEELRHYSGAVVLAVRRDDAGGKSIVAVGEAGHFPELFWCGAAMARLLDSGIAEFHVHLMAETPEARQAVLQDILGVTHH